MDEPVGQIPSWRQGHHLWTDGRTKLVLLPGLGTRTGDAMRIFDFGIRHLTREGGYRRDRDFLEASYAGSTKGDAWMPRVYAPGDTRQPFLQTADAVASTLEWYRAAFPDDTRFAVIAYSLGGVLALDGTAMAVARDREGWKGRLTALVTLASPIRGCSIGPYLGWASLLMPGPEIDPLGPLGAELATRWEDPAERLRVEKRAAFLRAEGIRLLTLADPEDAVVRPDEALLPAPGETEADLLVNARRLRPGTHGHGGVLDEPAVWNRVLNLIGEQAGANPQTAGPGPAPTVEPVPDPIDVELEAIKQRLRSEGRLRS